jgi:hypothetical protein
VEGFASITLVPLTDGSSKFLKEEAILV